MKDQEEPERPVYSHEDYVGRDSRTEMDMPCFGYGFLIPELDPVYLLSTDQAVLRIRIRIRIHVFLGLLDPYPDPLVIGMDPDPSTQAWEIF